MITQPMDRSDDAFRTHRHDVLNALQLIRAYIQMNRPESAIQSVDRLAAWLKSLGQWQNHIQGSSQGNILDPLLAPTDGKSSQLLWVAARCPHVHFEAAIELPDLSPNVERELAACWDWLNTQCSERGIPLMRVCFRGTVRDCQEEPTGVEVQLLDTPDVKAWFESIDDEQRFTGTCVNLVLKS